MIFVSQATTNTTESVIGTFELKYKVDTAIEQPTVIYATPKDMSPTWYPNGYDVIINNGGSQPDKIQIDGEFITVQYIDPVYNGNTITVRIEPK